MGDNIALHRCCECHGLSPRAAVDTFGEALAFVYLWRQFDSRIAKLQIWNYSSVGTSLLVNGREEFARGVSSAPNATISMVNSDDLNTSERILSGSKVDHFRSSMTGFRIRSRYFDQWNSSSDQIKTRPKLMIAAPMW